MASCEEPLIEALQAQESTAGHSGTRPHLGTDHVVAAGRATGTVGADEALSNVTHAILRDSALEIASPIAAKARGAEA